MFSQICLFGFPPSFQSQPWILLEGFPSSMRISAFERKCSLLVWRTYRPDSSSTCRPSTLQFSQENPTPTPHPEFPLASVKQPPNPHPVKRSCLGALSPRRCWFWAADDLILTLFVQCWAWGGGFLVPDALRDVVCLTWAVLS